MYRKWWLCSILTAVLVVSGCNDSDSSGDDSGAEKPTNTANTVPEASAGSDQNVKVGSTVTLNGSESRDADEDTLTYHWSFDKKPEGSDASFSDASAAKPTFTADKAGKYRIDLVVNDGQIDSTADEVIVTASSGNSAPVAEAGDDQQIETGKRVTLDGSQSTDADGDNLSFSWSIASRPDGSSAKLADAASVKPYFTPDVDGIYKLMLVVSDGKIKSKPDSIQISATTANNVPVADAGPDQNVVAGQTVELNGGASRDADGDTLTYKWSFVSKPKQSKALLDNSDTVAPEFKADTAGDYVVKLVVSDGQLSSKADNVVVSVSKANARPTANAGKDQQVTAGAKVVLDGTGSRDADGDKLAYKWQIVSKPKNSRASLSNTSSAAPSFTPDVAGDYVVQLVVNDGSVDSAADQVVISAGEKNLAPVANAGNDRNVDTGVLVSLDGAGSTDANNDELNYEWHFVSKPKASQTSLVQAATVTPSFTPDVDGSYVIELIVDDGELKSEADRVRINAQTANSAPVANAGRDQDGFTGQLVTLNGGASSDADNDMLSYDWSFQSLPDGSEARLKGAQTRSPTFTPDLVGDYVINLRVSDGTATSETDSVRVSVAEQTLQFEIYDDGGFFGDGDPGFKSSSLPYTSGSTRQESRIGGSSTLDLDRFRLTARGKNYTITNLRVTDSSGGDLNPRFIGLVDGQTIKDGQSVTFNLQTDYVNASNARVVFEFEVKETGDTFKATYSLTLR